MTRSFSGCRFDPRDGHLEGPSGSATLRPQAGRLLERFLDEPGEMLDRETLIAAVWDEGSVVDFESGLAALMRELRQALDQVGAGAKLIETMPRRGYRFHGTPDSSDPPSPQSGSRGSRAVPIALLAAIAVLALAGWIAWWLQPGPSIDPPALAILPFENYLTDEAGETRLGRLMADTLLAELGAAEPEQLLLIGRASLRPYQDLEDVARRVADDLGVALLLEGAIVSGADSGWRIDARLVHMPRGTILWSSSVTLEEQSEFPASAAAAALIGELLTKWPSLSAGLMGDPA